MVETLSYRSRNLPHWIVADKSFFVTVRQKGTLSPDMMKCLRDERENAQVNNLSHEDIEKMNRQHFNHIESILDSYDPNSAALLRPGVPEVILESIRWLETKREWKIYAAVIMPSHIHMLIRNKGGHSDSLNEDIGKVKRFSATRINSLLEMRGNFWQSENFDHWCRSPESFDKHYAYIINNPVKAGLVKYADDWPWQINGK
ncbi:MAG: transposase [Kiritimatiellae bacterium]|nr:transposase [Kiritimatiellia bacterium]